ncbi:M3 family oligoendopeptidase [Acholeplasma hippikon]|uniref:Oligoendopeptidase, M3 family n=1 Tax=Acholeplasma hippikon TaxID=264636 RepID=A0A449BII4_9MOLU|nr:M3 family oligoendopeptidase [Acholeplasma hippikon]VEU82240.1 oligoendopeptidase, M3 family [Acholeplasma hippikon]
MKFQDFKYERIDKEQAKAKMTELKEQFEKATSAQEQLEIIKAYNDYNDYIDTMFQLASVRYTINTADEFYAAEQDYMDEAAPEITEFNVLFEKAVVESKFRTELEKELGSLLFKQYELGIKVFDASVIELIQEENKLNSEYTKVRGTAKIEFNGETYNLSSIGKLTTDKDRNIRRGASLAVANWYKENETKIDEIYDKAVKVRTEIAKKLGYENFIQLGYDRLKRVDYDASDVKKYREQILKDVVPYVEALERRRAKRLGIEKPLSYDLNLNFLSGNPTPKGDMKHLVNQAMEMYDEMSKETSAFFRMMVEKDLFDLESKAGKASGGYCTYFPKFEAPFIFANFNGTQHDVDVLTHEAGHAFQVYTSRNLLPSQRWPGYEGCEIHSMSMEFLAWPWIQKFFQEDTEKYKFSHLSGAITFLPYGALVDHFQHEVYANPNMTPAERKATWKALEAKYQPWKQYDEEDPTSEGLWWFRQLHIFDSPFYYIDYTLAQVIAFDFWGRNQVDRKSTWDNYYALCQLGGSKSFVGLLNATNLPVPFKENTIARIMAPLKAYLDQVDDTKF